MSAEPVTARPVVEPAAAPGPSPLGRLLALVPAGVKAALARFATTRLPWLLPAWLVEVLAAATALGMRLARRPVVATMRENLRVVLGEDVAPAVLERALADALRGYYGHWYSFLRMPAVGAAGMRATVELHGEEHVRAARAAGRGVVIACIHSGRYEWGSAALSVAAAEITGAPMTAVAVTMGSEVVQDVLTTMRRGAGNGEVLWIDPGAADGRVRLARGLLRRLRSAQVVGVMLDRHAVGTRAEVEMFGRPIALAVSPVTLAARTNAALLPAACFVERGRVHFRVHPEVPVPVDPALGEDERCRRALQAVARVFEAEIAEHPTAWHAISEVFRSAR